VESGWLFYPFLDLYLNISIRGDNCKKSVRFSPGSSAAAAKQLDIDE